MDGEFLMASGYKAISMGRLPPELQAMARQMVPTQKQIKVHRVVMAAHLGRALERHEIIHHRNGDPADNRLSNLRLITRRTHLIAPSDDIAKAIDRDRAPGKTLARARRRPNAAP